jgi:hypothetical protein
MSWYSKVSKDIGHLPDCIEYYYAQLDDARKEIKVYGNLERASAALPGIVEQRDCEKYVDGEADVVDLEKIVNEFALLRNQWLGIIKGLDIKQWQVSNIIKLRTAGMEDVHI